MKAIILAGGSGTRLWPLSRKNYPKQFLRLNSDKSLLQQTVERFLDAVKPEDIIIVTNNDYKFHVQADIHNLGSETIIPDSNIILEPAGRNTAPAIAFAVKYCMEKLGCGEDEVVFISPSDHIIKPVERFVEFVDISAEIAKEGYIVTFGIKPESPETGYGYIKTGDRLKAIGDNMKGYKVEEFAEKPDIKTAKKYLKEGNYYWNSGMFVFSIGTIIREIEYHEPKIMELFNKGFEEMLLNFDRMPNISMDYAIAERSDKMAVLPIEIYWNDIGSWDSLYDALDKDKNGNARKGNVLTFDVKNSLIIGNKRLITALGMEDCLIIESDDAVLVAKRGKAQEVKDVVNILKDAGMREADEHITTYRPWGYYTVLEEGDRYKIKRINVHPLKKLSLQMHHHRSEHWVVVKGTAKVTLGDKEIFVHENESVYVPKTTPHRLENPGKVPLEIIEVQNGEYVGEDDIVRMDDDYGRIC